MYKIKRLNKCNAIELTWIDTNLRYSQKSYGLIDSIKTAVRNSRSRIADKLQASIDRTAIRNNELRSQLSSSASRSYDIEKKLIKDAKSLKSRVLKFDRLSGALQLHR